MRAYELASRMLARVTLPVICTVVSFPDRPPKWRVEGGGGLGTRLTNKEHVNLFAPAYVQVIEMRFCQKSSRFALRATTSTSPTLSGEFC